MSGKRDLYSVTLNKAQIERALEAYVLAASATGPATKVARAELPIPLVEVIVRVSEKRQRKAKLPTFGDLMAAKAPQ